MNSAYVTFDELNPDSGAGKVCLHEIEALKRVSNLQCVISRPDIKGASKYEFNPFLYDYFIAQLVPKDLELLHLSCSPALAILEATNPKTYVVNIVAHDLKTSIEEHERYYGVGSYPFVHNTDPYLHQLLLKHAEGANSIITPSTASARWISDNLQNRKIKVIPHGVDMPSDVAPPPGVFRAGYLGTFGPDKGLVYLTMAWKYVDGPDCELIFAGSCSHYIQPLLPPLAAALRVCRVLGWVNDVKDFYNQISVYVQPSVTEGFGIETLEAMAFGRPVIISSGAGAADVVRDGVDGFIIPPRDPKAILEKITFFRQNPSSISEMGLAAHERAKEYTWERVEQQYEQFYKEILGGAGLC